MMTQREIGETLGCTRQMAALHVKRGCPRTTPEAVLAWYHSTIRSKCDRQRPRVPQAALVGPAPGSRILDIIEDQCAAIEMDGDIRALGNQISQHRRFFPSIENNCAVRDVINAFHAKWFAPK
jgi:hypothetical protein